MAHLDGYSDKFERRRGRRYRILAPVAFRWQTSAGEMRQANGISRDISGHGILVICNSVPIPGSPVEVTVNLPVPWARTATLRGHGVVVRLQPETGHPWGFAATIEFDEEVNEGDAEGRAGSDPVASLLAAPPEASGAHHEDLASLSGFEIDKIGLWRSRGGTA